MKSPTVRRGVLALAGAAAALMLCSLGAATEAQASTLYACVEKNGSAHVYAKKPKCKKGESKLSWNTTGPAGKNGANGSNGASGANGSNGANGAAVGYFAEQSGGTFLSGTVTKLNGLEKTLPAGSYLVSANVPLEGYAEQAGAGAREECMLYVANELKVTRKWAAAFFDVAGPQYIAEGDLNLRMGLTLASPATVTVKCKQGFGVGNGLEVQALGGTLSAEQVTSIG